jgi:3-deoxy-manno-octulosonate cytidylyltransferase (CMP-KDO synthetase)
MPQGFIIIIPARYASTRFPGKPLTMIGNKSMVQRVWEAANAVKNVAGVYVATDNPEIFNHVMQFGSAIMTSPKHPSGTDRCAEAMELLQAETDIVVNIQGDEPFIKPEQVEMLINMFANPEVEIATLKKQIEHADEIHNPNVVKVVTDIHNKALYFSRSVIPFAREETTAPKYYRHIGMYAYRANTLSKITQLQPSHLENTEKLEQLRWLENGYHIAVAETEWQSPAVDTPEDLEAANIFLETQF